MNCLFITIISYPFGGGEEFMFQCMRWCQSHGYQVIWLSFVDKYRKNHKRFKVRNYSEGILVDIPNGYNETTIKTWIRLIKPMFINTQGIDMVKIIQSVSYSLIPIICGYHFWTDLVDLNPSTYNRDIMGNISKHKISEGFKRIQTQPKVFPYVCSKFVSDVVKTVSNIQLPIVYASCNEEKIKVDINPWTNQYITHINIHKLKGGYITEKLIIGIPEAKFICISTEPNSEELDTRIKQSLNSESKYMERTENIREIYKQTRILLVPSIVDETFCRTVCEAMANGIPICTTGKGNIINLVGNSALILKEEDDWTGPVKQLYNSETLINYYSSSIKERYKLFSEDMASKQFKTLLDSAILSTPYKNVMIIVPFCDQGLGIQAKHYIRALEPEFKTHIFSFSPYYGNVLSMQKDPKEWEHPSVYYTEHNREQITDEEIITFVKNKNIGLCIIPETCWFRVFEIAKLLRILNVKCFAIPNIEIVRSDEIYKHEEFYKVLCNNMLCYNKLKEYGLTNVEYLGFSIPQNIKTKMLSATVKFCCIGGMNAFSRKHVLEVCEAFILARNIFSNIMLTVTVQGPDNHKINKYKNIPGINVITDHLSHNDIMSIIQASNVMIQVSSREGLGLGFFESLSVGTPVLTLDRQPYNEIINMANGWLIPCYEVPVSDNDKSIITEAHFNIDELKNKIVKITIEHNFKRENKKFEDRYQEFKNYFHKIISYN